MNNQDRDLILAYAAGQLSGADAEAASARIASDPELAAELASQQLAMSSLSSMPSVAMTSAERTGLRSHLINELNLEAAPVAAAAPSRWASWWKPVAGLAAAAAVVTAIVVLPATLSGDDDFLQAVPAESDTAALEEATFTDSAGSADGASSGTAATTTAAASESAGEESPQASDVSTDEVLDATAGADTPSEAEDGLDLAQYKLAPLDTQRGSTLEACVEQLSDELPPGDLITLGTTIVDGVETLFVGITDETGITSVASIDIDDCRVVEIAS